jgi:hypothetical protein
MKFSLPKLPFDPSVVLVQIAVLGDRVATLHKLAGPELRRLVDTHDLPHSTVNALLAYGDRFVKGMAIVKETVKQLAALVEGSPVESNPPLPVKKHD